MDLLVVGEDSVSTRWTADAIIVNLSVSTERFSGGAAYGPTLRDESMAHKL